MIILTEQSQQ